MGQQKCFQALNYYPFLNWTQKSLWIFDDIHSIWKSRSTDSFAMLKNNAFSYFGLVFLDICVATFVVLPYVKDHTVYKGCQQSFCNISHAIGKPVRFSVHLGHLELRIFLWRPFPLNLLSTPRFSHCASPAASVASAASASASTGKA